LESYESHLVAENTMGARVRRLAETGKLLNEMAILFRIVLNWRWAVCAPRAWRPISEWRDRLRIVSRGCYNS